MQNAECRKSDFRMFENLLLTREGAIAVATINRPQVLNALNTETLHELRRLTLELTEDATVRSVIITGAGEKAFVAGADIRELGSLSAAGAREHARQGQQVLDLIERMGK